MDIVQITDLHLSKDKGNELYNINTYNSAKTIIEYIAKHKKSIDYLIITGRYDNRYLMIVVDEERAWLMII